MQPWGNIGNSYIIADVLKRKFLPLVWNCSKRCERKLKRDHMADIQQARHVRSRGFWRQTSCYQQNVVKNIR